jgi:subtilisin-like proprotein convertase family protein
MSFYNSGLLLSLITLSLISCTPSGGGSSSGSGTTTKTGATNTASNDTPIPGADDPLASYAWHLENTGQSTFSSSAGTAGEDMDIKEVQTSGIKGSGIKIAVSDTGIDIYHADLADNQLSSLHRDYSNDSSSTWRNGNPYPIEGEAHGTAVTGLIAAIGWNGIGSRGVAPSANYAGFLFVGDFHNSASSYEAKTLDQMTGAFDIFNYSYGYAGCEFTPATSTVINAYKTGVTNLRSGKGAIYIQAAGNEYMGTNSDCYTNDSSSFLGNTNTSEDHNHPYVILAAAVNAKGKIASYSSPGSGLWVASAGGESGSTTPAMLTTDILSCDDGFSTSSSSVAGFNKGALALNSNCNYTSIMNGTSSATPVLAGIVALMLEANPNLTWRDVKHILAVTADKINYSTAAIPHPGGASYALSGYTYDYSYVRNAAGYDYSNTFGFGRVNANNAVTMAKTYTSALGTYVETINTSTNAWLYNSATLNLSIPDKSSTGVSSSLTVSQSYTIESVQIKFSTDHTYVGDLGVQLTSPLGTTSRLLLINSNIKDSSLTDFTLISNAFYGENASGPWTIKVVDGATTDTGKLISWKLKINGH